MPLLPGVACLEALSYRVRMNIGEETKHICFITHLARYFARCWSTPQFVEPSILADRQTDISRKLAILKALPSPPVSIPILSELESILPQLFSSSHPQVLTHGDLSKTNILVSPDTYQVTAIVDWSLAEVLPFRLELDSLFLMTECMDLRDWHNYSCRSQLWNAFWAGFWTASGVEEHARESVRKTAEAAAKFGVVLRYAFARDNAGRALDIPFTSDTMLAMLKTWLGD
ncbi:hypothetical protein PT974_04160 [Cladobotryum mycophilum]|uniref:Aminoglycoside phosphotransferase domain-containing protein n=1 Tax=Cladobotryum mycophilum TaxID=491253 RepID=A0ABR0SU96_9HYPO